jgi:hypothetical protein
MNVSGAALSNPSRDRFKRAAWLGWQQPWADAANGLFILAFLLLG